MPMLINSIRRIGMIPVHLNSFKKCHIEEGLNLFDVYSKILYVRTYIQLYSMMVATYTINPLVQKILLTYLHLFARISRTMCMMRDQVRNILFIFKWLWIHTVFNIILFYYYIYNPEYVHLVTLEVVFSHVCFKDNMRVIIRN